MNRDQIISAIKAQPAHVEAVDVPGIGTMYVRKLRGKAYADYVIQGAAAGDGRGASLNAVLLAHAVCDEAGARVFTDDDAATLDDLDAAAYLALVKVAGRLNAVDTAAAEKK